MYGSVKTRLSMNPHKKHMGFVFISGRGMDKDSRQIMLLNQYDKKTKFYTQADIEYLMGFIAKKNKDQNKQEYYRTILFKEMHRKRA